MTHYNDCPECGKALSAKYKRCSCGWRKEHEVVPVQADHGCQYQSKGRRCTLSGTMSHSTHASEIWHCHLHYHSLGDPKKGEELLDYIENHYDEIMASQRDWHLSLHEQQTMIIRKINYEDEYK